MNFYNKISKSEIENVFKDKERREKAESLLKDPIKIEQFINKVSSKLDNIPIVGSYFSDVPILCYLIRDYVNHSYKEIPLATIICIVIALLYFISPIDLIPDSIPILGKIDDAAVIMFAVDAAHNDISDYKRWKNL